MADSLPVGSAATVVPKPTGAAIKPLGEDSLSWGGTGTGRLGPGVMPRTKQFKVDEAVIKAMHVFWKHGYGPTSMQDLVHCMGIGRGSIYDTFGSKHGLFVRALRVYHRIVPGRDVGVDIFAIPGHIERIRVRHQGGRGRRVPRRLFSGQHGP